MEHPLTPPLQVDSGPSRPLPSPPTPSETRRLEESRLRSKALRDQREAAERASGVTDSTPRTSTGLVETTDIQLAGRKRPHSSVTRGTVPTSNRDARALNEDGNNGALRPAKKFTKFVDYNFSAMTDTKGGFLSTEDDPWNKSLSSSTATATGEAQPGGGGQDMKPAQMTAAEWERLQLIRKLQRTRAGPFEPGLSVLADEATRKRCRECGSLEIDWMWEDIFKCAVCAACKEKHPERYSLLTKTECREDYLLTDQELKDAELLPHLSRPNPHKSHWHDMMLFLRYQVEDYAFSKKWGSADALDAEYEKRETDKKRRKEAKFKEKLQDLKRKTRTEAVRRQRAAGVKASKFGDAIGGEGRHVHEWGRLAEKEDGTTVRTCVSCGMEVEEMEF